MAATPAVQQQLQFIGMRIARDSQLAILGAVADSLANVKQIIQASSPTAPGVGAQVDIKA